MTGAADAAPTHPVTLATKRIDGPRVLNEVNTIIPFPVPAAYEHYS